MPDCCYDNLNISMETKEIKLPDSVKREEKEEVLEEVYDSLSTFKASVISENSEFINKEVDIE